MAKKGSPKQKKLTYQVVFSYLIMNLVSISLFTYVLSNNQIELISENTRYKSIELTQGLSQNLNSELSNQTIEIESIVDEAFHSQNIPYLIIVNDSVKYHHGGIEVVPEDIEIQVAKSLSLKEYSGAPVHLNFDSEKRTLDFYIPLTREVKTVVMGRVELTEFSDRFTTLYQSIGITVLLLSLMYLIFGIVLHKSVMQPIVKLFEATGKVAQGKFDFRVSIKRNDEIGALADRFNYMTETIEKSVESLEIHMRKIEEAKKQIEIMAITDELTKLYNRHYLFEKLNFLIRLSGRYKCKLGIMILDVDFFKKVNDNYGHKTGDEVLKAVAATIIKTCRKVDIASRYGGEEMVVVCPETNLENTILLAKRLNKAIEKISFKLSDTENLTVTVSIGVTEFSIMKDSSKKTLDAAELIDAADSALYKAKENGRNRVEVFGIES